LQDLFWFHTQIIPHFSVSLDHPRNRRAHTRFHPDHWCYPGKTSPIRFITEGAPKRLVGPSANRPLPRSEVMAHTDRTLIVGTIVDEEEDVWSN
jgi:hypothetical protein